MIPKVIHYCWFGRNPLPQLAIDCIKSWKRYLPDYEIKEWNEDNFDVNSIAYVKEAYKEKKYAFVSDYARFWILYHHGGLYFDTDVEVIKSMDDIISVGGFMGCENDCINPGLGMAVAPGLGIYKDMLDIYAKLSFYNADGTLNQTTIVEYTTKLLIQHGMKNETGIQEVSGIWIYPKDFFCPLDYKTGVLTITDNTRTIHHYTASWHTPSQKFKIFLTQKLGSGIMLKLSKIKQALKRLL